MFSTKYKGIHVSVSIFSQINLLRESGYRKGDPIAAYVFLLCAQILLHMLDNIKNIEGISTNKQL